MMKLTDVPTKVIGYLLVAGNRCSAVCPSTTVILRVCWIGGPCVVYYWKYRQRSAVTILMGVSSETTFQVTKNNFLLFEEGGVPFDNKVM